jgi:hypothetical protein
MAARHAAIAAVAAVVSMSAADTTIPGDSDAFPIAAAREGLARMIVAFSETGAVDPPECPLVDRNTVIGALARAGVDAPLREWTLDTPTSGDALTCSGVYVGVEDDESFPELDLELRVTDVGSGGGAVANTGAVLAVTDLPGGTTGACESDRFVTVCEEEWHDGGLEVTVLVSDRIAFDRVTASTILGDLVPAVVANLAAGSTDVADPLRAVIAAEGAAASEGLGRFVDANADQVGEGAEIACPAVTGGTMAELLHDAGVDEDLDDWSAALDAVTFPEDLDPVPVRLTCSGGSDLDVRLIVIDFGETGAAEDFVASVGLAEGGSAADLVSGDLTVGSCTQAAGVELCSEWWWADGLVVGTWLSGDAAAIGGSDAANLLVSALPSVITNLAGS